MIERCEHGDVAWDGIREHSGSYGSAVGTCRECGAAVASSLSGRHAITTDEGDGDREEMEEALLQSGPA